jgi:hypothetical protein
MLKAMHLFAFDKSSAYLTYVMSETGFARGKGGGGKFDIHQSAAL